MIRKSRFIDYNISEDIASKYEIIGLLGEGSYGKVYRVYNKQSKVFHACKAMEKINLKRPDRFRIEIELLKSCDHNNIVKLYEIFESPTTIFLIMEECTGGELFQILKHRYTSKNPYTEREAANLFKQVMSAITYCHNRGVSHRDLKPENLVFLSKTDNVLKLIDFGLSKYFKKLNSKNNKMESVVGTLCYMAPEVFSGTYNEKCDVWSAGVILCVLLCGKPPFIAKTPSDTVKKIKSFSFDFSNSAHWKQISHEAKDLITKILTNSESRLSSEGVLQHDWVRLLAPNSSEQILELEIDKMIEFSFLNKLQKSIISFISYRFSFEQINLLNQIFSGLDKNTDGEISIVELKEGLQILIKEHLIELDEEEIDFLFNEIDLDKNGLINYTEFISASIDYRNLIKKEHVVEAFKSFDRDKSGRISINELTDVINPISDTDLDDMKVLMDSLDLNGDGEIDLDEFLNAVGIEY